MNVKITIDGKALSVPEGLPIRKAALKNGIYIPGICAHPDLPPVRLVKWSERVYRGEEVNIGDFKSETAGDDGNCNLCLIAVNMSDELVRACETKAVEGMIVRTQGEDIQRDRREALVKILTHHPHACLTCAQKEGCSLTQCSSNVPENERCCILLNRCELGKIVDYVGLPEGLPKYVPEGFYKTEDDPFFIRDYNLCIGCLRCVRICNDVRGVNALFATFKDGRIWVGTSEPGLLKDSCCRFCGACVEVCPTGALRDKPDSEPVHRGERAPCVNACPAGIDIPAYLRRIAIGDISGALQVIYDRVPFPGILGYVCFHPCEEVCKRNELDQSIAICALKRFVYENVPTGAISLPPKAQSSGKKVAIFGSGPSGLTAAFYLARNGHEVTVFEAAQKIGGMLRNAIPQYRLPEFVLDDELKILHDIGVTFRTGVHLGSDIQLKDVLNDGFDAVLLAVGTTGSRKLNVPGEDSSNVVQALSFLANVRSGKAGKIERKVVVIGGGNVAIDAAMTARRLGSDDVTMVCLESRDEMPAHDWEIAQATAEGVKVKPGWGPMEFKTKDGQLERILLKRCTRVFDEKGRFHPQYEETDTTEIPADFAILAIGQQVDMTGLLPASKLETDPDGTLHVDSKTFLTTIPAVFAAGDAVSGPASVIEAIASGRKAADHIDRYLGGQGLESAPVADEVCDDPFLGRDEDFHQRVIPRPVQLDPNIRVNSFEVIEQSCDAESARLMALQCLRCNLRATITPVFLPPDKWQVLTLENIQKVPMIEGVVQIANAGKKVMKIAGTPDMKNLLLDEVKHQPEGSLFYWEEDRMYSKRESELIQRHLQEFGEMPGGGGDLDDLF